MNMTPAGADIAEGYHLFSKNSYARFGPGSQAFNVRFLRIRTKRSPETAELTPDSLLMENFSRTWLLVE